MNLRLPFRALLCVCFALIATGCGAIKVTPKYAALGMGPLGEVKPVKVAVTVVDHRPDDERQPVGYIYNAFGGRARSFESTVPINDVVFDAVKSELEVNGHQVGRAPMAGADLELEFDVERFFYECKPHMWDVELVVTLQSDVKAFRPVGATSPTAFRVNVTHRDGRFAVAGKSHEKFINEGLAEFMRQFSFDATLKKAMGSPP